MHLSLLLLLAHWHWAECNFFPPPTSALLITSCSHAGKTRRHKWCLLNQESTVHVEGGTRSLKRCFSSKQNGSKSSQNIRASAWWCHKISDFPHRSHLDLFLKNKNSSPSSSASLTATAELLSHYWTSKAIFCCIFHLSGATYFISLPSLKLIWNTYIFQKKSSANLTQW